MQDPILESLERALDEIGHIDRLLERQARALEHILVGRDQLDGMVRRPLGPMDALFSVIANFRRKMLSRAFDLEIAFSEAGLAGEAGAQLGEGFFVHHHGDVVSIVPTASASFLFRGHHPDTTILDGTILLRQPVRATRNNRHVWEVVIELAVDVDIDRELAVARLRPVSAMRLCNPRLERSTVLDFVHVDERSGVHREIFAQLEGQMAKRMIALGQVSLPLVSITPNVHGCTMEEELRLASRTLPKRRDERKLVRRPDRRFGQFIRVLHDHIRPVLAGEFRKRGARLDSVEFSSGGAKCQGSIHWHEDIVIVGPWDVDIDVTVTVHYDLFFTHWSFPRRIPRSLVLQPTVYIIDVDVDDAPWGMADRIAGLAMQEAKKVARREIKRIDVPVAFEHFKCARAHASFEEYGVQLAIQTD